METVPNQTTSSGNKKPVKRRFSTDNMWFVGGIAAALLFGWLIFPRLLFQAQSQPVAFSHRTHLKDASLECSRCHFLRADGSFSALPRTEDCALCHQRPLGKSAAEAAFVRDYVRTGKKVKWLTYQKQPDNVFFSHAAHSLENCNTCHRFTKKELCSLCHINVMNMDLPPTFRENRISGYSADTMKMQQCERCHANPTHLRATPASNGCFVCHK